MIKPFRGNTPRIHPEAYTAENASLIGDVTLEQGASVWYGAVLRGDGGSILVGENTNIQDNCVLHSRVTLGSNVTVGHGAILHGCTVEDGCLIGMGATVLNGAQIGAGSIVAAGALVTEGAQIPPGSMVMGVPAAVRRTVTREERAAALKNAAHYTALACEQLHNK